MFNKFIFKLPFGSQLLSPTPHSLTLPTTNGLYSGESLKTLMPKWLLLDVTLNYPIEVSELLQSTCSTHERFTQMCGCHTVDFVAPWSYMTLAQYFLSCLSCRIIFLGLWPNLTRRPRKPRGRYRRCKNHTFIFQNNKRVMAKELNFRYWRP